MSSLAATPPAPAAPPATLSRPNAARRYAVAVAVVAIATALLGLLQAWMGAERMRVPFAFYFAAVAVAAWYGGRAPGLLAAALSALVGNALFLPPFRAFSLSPDGLLQTGAFLLSASIVVYVTEKMTRAEAAARSSKEWLATTLRSIGDAVIVTDEAGCVRFMNRVAQDLTGWGEAEAEGRPLAEVFRVVNEQTREAVESPVERVLREGAVVGLANHTVLVGKGGSEMPIDDSAAPVRDEAGRTVGVVLVFHEVSERRRAESALRESEERMRAITETASDAIISIDEESRITFVNSAAEKIFGHTRQEMLGQSLTMLMPDYLRQAHRDGLRRYLETGRRHISWESVELAGLRKSGEEFPLEVSFAEFTQGGRRYFTGIARDITERRLAEESRTRLAAIVESSDDAILSKTLDGTITSWNAGAERMYGYAAAEVVGRSVSVIIPPERAGELEEILGKIRRAERVEHLETVRVRKDGTRVNVSVTVSPVRDGAGRIVGASTVARDITGRKRAEREREELHAHAEAARARVEASEERYRALADAMPQIVWTARPDGYIDYYNRRWFEYTGMTLEQTKGWGWQPVLHPDDVELALKRWSRAVQTGETFQIEYRYRRAADGAYRWHLGRAEPMRDASGQVVRWFGTATDIHARRQAEETVRFIAEASTLLGSSLDYETTLEQLARLSVAALADYCLVDVLDDAGQARRVATAHVDPLAEELVGELRRYPPDMAKAEGIPAVLRSGRPQIYSALSEDALKAVARDAGHLDLLRRLGLRAFMTVPLLARGRTLGALTFSSTREGREFAAADLAFAEELARRAALAIDNARLYRRAQDANRSKDEFLATLSHELRTPLTPIIGWVHMLRGGIIGAAEAELGLSVIDKNSQSLARLINDLLDMTSILSGKMRLERAEVQLDAAVREAVETVRPQAEARGVRLEADFDAAGASAPTVSGDRTRLVQVFWNLLNNAVKFSPDGGRVGVRVEAADGHARVRVEDDGAGIPADFLPHVFERFRQADGSTTRRHGGLGIGLSLVKSFVEAHGGSVSAESDGEGRGSRFTVTLPLLETWNAERGTRNAGQADENSAILYPQPAMPQRRVLVVEDAADTLDMLQFIFEARGYRLTLCETAEEALRLAPSMWFDVVVSDIGLPQTDGYELIRRLRKLPHLRDVPAVALTGYAAPKDAEAARAAGFDLHLPKPVDPAELASAVEQLLKERARPSSPPAP